MKLEAIIISETRKAQKTNAVFTEMEWISAAWSSKAAGVRRCESIRTLN